mgnify:CR=1 FL=1
MDSKQIVDSVWRVAPKKELLSFFKELSLRDEKIARKLKDRFLKEFEWNYKSDIEKAFEEYITHEFYDESMHDWDSISSNVEKILEKARHYFNSGEYEKSSEIGLLVLETLSETFDYTEIEEFPYDPDYMIYNDDGVEYDAGKVRFVKSAAELIAEAVRLWVESGSLGEERLKTLMTHFRKVALEIADDDSINGCRDAIKAYEELSSSFLSEEDILKEKISMIENGGGETTAMEVYALLKDHPVGEWTDESFAMKYIHMPHLALSFVNDLENKDRDEDALSAVNAFFKQDHGKYHYESLQDKLYDLTKKVGETDKFIELAESYFINRGDKLKYYHDLKEIIPEEDWKNVLESLLPKCSEALTVYSGDWLLDIYSEEAMQSELYDSICSLKSATWAWERSYGEILSRKINLLYRYRRSLTPEQIDLLGKQCVDELYKKASGYDIKSYRYLADSIKTLSRVNRAYALKMEEFKEYLHKEFPRRRKLFELL